MSRRAAVVTKHEKPSVRIGDRFRYRAADGMGSVYTVVGIEGRTAHLTTPFRGMDCPTTNLLEDLLSEEDFERLPRPDES